MDMYEVNKWKLEGFEDEKDEEIEVFKVDSDKKAEWAMQKIKQEQEEYKRIKRLCEAMIDEYKDRILEAEKEMFRGTGYFKDQLRNYFDKMPHHVTKTQETYKLGLGKLVLKKQQPEVKKDDEALLKWMKRANLNEYVKVVEMPAWGELKKTLEYINGNYITADGEVVEGITLIERDDKFEVVI